MMTTLINAAIRRASGMTRAWQTLRRALAIFVRIDGTQRAGAFAHFAFFSSFPAIILIVAAASVVLDRQRATREIIAFIENCVPIGADKEGYIFRTIEGVATSRGHASVVAMILLCWGAMRFLATMVRATNRAWGPEIHNWWRLPLKSLALLLIIVVSVPPGVLKTVWIKEVGISGLGQDGALGGSIALLMWIYLSSVIFIFGACLCAAHSNEGPAPRTAARA